MPTTITEFPMFEPVHPYRTGLYSQSPRPVPLLARLKLSG